MDRINVRPLHLTGQAGVVAHNDLSDKASEFMAPRAAESLPEPWDPHGPVGDFGHLLNHTNAAAPYTHGLDGVNQVDNYLFINISVAAFFTLLVATLLYRWYQMFSSHLRHLLTMGSGRLEDQRYWMYNHSHFWPKLKKDLLYAPLGKVRHNKEVQLSRAITIGTLPSRFHTVLLSLYVALNLAWCLALTWSREDEFSVIAQLRGRTGSLAAFNLIPTILFALRNNPLIPITGVSYDTYNLLHRWCARITMMEAFVHTICWAVNTMQAGGMHQVHVALSTSTSYRWGLVATCAFGVISIQTISPLRHAFYETFLAGHRLLVILVIAGVYIHLDRANLPQLPYVWLAIAFWAVEWVWRTLRIMYYNVSRRKGITKVTVEALPAEACRVTFDLVRPWQWKPGCHVHAYLPAFALWSSHPFSIAWADSRPRDPPLVIEMEKMSSTAMSMKHFEAEPRISTEHSAAYSRKGVMAPTVATVVEATHKPSSENMALPRDAAVTSVSLVMRARTGMTRKLYEKASRSKTGSITTWGAIEGPYGGHEPMTSYGTVLLFAGGVGITHCVGYVHHLLLQYQAGTSSTHKILLVWTVPNTEALEWVRVWMDQILRMEGRRDVLKIQLFVTKPRHRAEVISNTGSVQMFPGRCNPATIIEKEMQERIGAMGVTVCGPGAFADSVRAAVRSVVTEGAVDFVEEAFTY
jgi:predicted ferric reductase